MAGRFDFAEAVIKFVGDGSALKPSLSGIEKTVGDATSRMASAAKVGLLGLTAAVGTIIAGAGTLGVFVKMSANAGDEISKMSQRVAIGAETLSGYKLAAELANLSLDDLGTALQRASKNIFEASRNSGDALDAFDALGISVKDNAGKLKTAEQVMLEVADKFATMEDGAQKTALAMEIFGRSGATMIPLLNQGSAAIAAQRKEADLLGVTWTTAQAKQAEAFNDNLKRIEAGLAGFRNMVAQGLLPFFDQALTAIIEKMKAWSASGDLQIWALRTGEVIVGAFVKSAEAVAVVARAGTLVVDSFRLVTAALRTLETGFDSFIGKELRGIGMLSGALARWMEFWGDPAAKRVRDFQRTTTDWADSFSLAAKQAAESAVEWWNAIGTSNQTAENFAATVEGLAQKFQSWAGKAFAAAAMAKAGLSDTAEAAKKPTEALQVLTFQVDGVTKSMTVMARTAPEAFVAVKDQVKALDEGFKVLQTRGEASLQDTLEWMQRRAALFRAGTPERNQAEAEAFKFARDMADKLFAHEQALGLKSLQDMIDFEKRKAAAAKAGSEERMKAEEAVFQKQEDLRNKARSAALGILGEVKERLEARGITEATQTDVIREMQAIQQERAAQITGTVGRFQMGGAVDLEQLMQGFKNMTSVEELQKQFQQLGGPGGIFGQAGKIALGPLTEQLGLGVTSQTLKDLFAQGRPDLAEQLLSRFGPEGGGPGGAVPIAGPLAGVGAGTKTEMDAAAAALDEGLTKMEARVQESGSRIKTTLFNNLEQWFVDKLMGQSERN